MTTVRRAMLVLIPALLLLGLPARCRGEQLSIYAYAGREPDASGLIYYRGRYLDAASGRFTQRDPLGLAAGINDYAYVEANPVNAVDPLGTDPHDLGADDAKAAAYAGKPYWDWYSDRHLGPWAQAQALRDAQRPAWIPAAVIFGGVVGGALLPEIAALAELPPALASASLYVVVPVYNAVNALANSNPGLYRGLPSAASSFGLSIGATLAQGGDITHGMVGGALGGLASGLMSSAAPTVKYGSGVLGLWGFRAAVTVLYQRFAPGAAALIEGQPLPAMPNPVDVGTRSLVNAFSPPTDSKLMLYSAEQAKKRK